MKALVYDGPGSRSWADVPDRRVQGARDVIIRVDAATICGTDLHILGRVQRLLDTLVAGQLDLGHMVTHWFELDEVTDAYDVFAAPPRSGALKVVLSR